MTRDMTVAEMSLHKAATTVCGCAWDDAPDLGTVTARLEWIRANSMGLGSDEEIDESELDALIDQARAANI
jgi:hypothetical protein